MSLTPPDRDRCQAEVPNKTWSPFNLGPADTDSQGRKFGGSTMADRRYRCVEKPVCIVEERKAGEDGLKGQMSLCADCFVQLFLQDPNKAVLFEDLRSSLSSVG